MIMSIIAKVLATRPVRNWLIKRAMATPYTHIMSADNRDVYMYRYWLFNPYDADTKKTRWSWLPSIRIHRIMVPDGDRHLHDHPWNARTFILDGHYDEERMVDRDPLTDSQYWQDPQVIALFRRLPGKTATLNHGEFHRITAVSPGGVWTLFMTGKYRGTWGFDVEGRKVIYWRYFKRKPKPWLIGSGKDCPIEFQGDQEVCAECGLRWDANDVDAPDCPPNDVKV